MIFRKIFIRMNKQRYDDSNSQDNFETLFPIPKLKQKNKIVAFGLCLILGLFGIHRFYLGKYITGFFQLLLSLLLFTKSLAWIPFAFVIIDLFRIAFDDRFTKRLIINFQNFTNSQNINIEQPTIRTLNEDEVVVVDSKPFSVENKGDK